MTLTMTCRHCSEVISAPDEDGLVDGVQTHARSHGDKPPLTREHILARFHRLQAREQAEHGPT
jgi:hypothetical protein